MILKEFDYDKKAIINPCDIVEKIDNFPEVVVSCFSRETFKRMLQRHNGREIARTSTANLEVPIYEIDCKGKRIAIFNSYVGAAGCVAFLEDLYAMGMKKLVLFGTCGVLNHDIDDISIIIPNRAVRDEGTSYHYMEPSDEVDVNVGTINKFKKFLGDLGISYKEGKVWTTDAIYRETLAKMNRRRDGGCIVVDMECSAVAAWANFREMQTLHFFYAADHLSEEGWNIRSLKNMDAVNEKDLIANIALKFAEIF